MKDIDNIVGAPANQAAVITRRKLVNLLVLFLASALAVSLLLIALKHGIHILKGVDLGDGSGAAADNKEGFSGLTNAIGDLRGPATAAVGGVGSLGVAAGGIMIGAGSPKGMRILGCGAGALAAVGLGNGIIE